MSSTILTGSTSKNAQKRALKQQWREQRKAGASAVRADLSTGSVPRETVRIAIVGGGLCGLGVALLLKQAGYEHVSIWERDAAVDVRRQGYGLTILQGGAALQRMGVYEAVRAVDTPSRSHYVFAASGALLGFFGTAWDDQALAAAGSSRRHNLHIPRELLRRLIHDALVAQFGHDLIRWGRKLVRMEARGSVSDVTFDTGETVTCDLVIGCDGIRSAVRSWRHAHVQDTQLNFLGLLVVLGVTGSAHPLTQHRVFQTVDGTTRLFAMPFSTSDPTRSVMWQLSFPCGESEAHRLSADLPMLHAHVLQRCAGWHAPVPEMLGHTDLSLLMGIPAYDRDPVLPDVGAGHTTASASASVATVSAATASSVEFPAIALMGDAAHPMSPFKGQGANQALLDCVTLVDCLASAGSVGQAVHEYHTAMLARVTPKLILSRERVGSFHAPTALAAPQVVDERSLDARQLAFLGERGVCAETGAELEAKIREMLAHFAAVDRARDTVADDPAVAASEENGPGDVKK